MHYIGRVEIAMSSTATGSPVNEEAFIQVEGINKPPKIYISVIQ